MDLPLGDGFEAKLNAINKPVELDYKNTPIIVEPLPTEKQVESCFTVVYKCIVEFWDYITQCFHKN